MSKSKIAIFCALPLLLTQTAVGAFNGTFEQAKGWSLSPAMQIQKGEGFNGSGELEAGSWKILACTDVSSVARGWTVKTASCSRYRVKKGEDGLYALACRGLMFIVR